MANKTSLTIRVDTKLENEAKKTLDLLGVTTPSLIKMLYSEIALTGKIPVSLRSSFPGLLCYDLMSDEEIEEDLKKISDDIKNGSFVTLEELNREMHEKYGIWWGCIR